MVQKILVLVANAFSWIAGALVVAIMLITTVDVVGRKFFQHSLSGALEINVLLLVATAFLGAGAAEWSGRHVEVVLVTSRLRGFASRVAGYFRLAVIAAVLGMLIYASAQAAMDSYNRGEFTNGILGVTVWPAKALIPLSFGLYLAVAVVKSLTRPAPADASADVTGAV